MLKKIAYWIILSFSLTMASKVHYIISDLQGLRIDYQDNKFIETKDGFAKVSLFIDEYETDKYTCTNNQSGLVQDCILLQNNDEYNAFLILYPEAAWTIAVYPNQNIALVSVLRTFIGANALFMHGSLKTTVK